MIDYVDANKIVNEIINRVCIKAEIIPVGSFRRKMKKVKDIDFLIISNKKDVLQNLSFRRKKINDIIDFGEIYANGSRRHSLFLNVDGKQLKSDFFVATKKEKPFALFHFTGSKDYNIRIRAKVKKNGLKLNQYGLFKDGKKITNSITSERKLAVYIGVTYRKPYMRF
jgi:DNA polymerase (family 10)